MNNYRRIDREKLEKSLKASIGDTEPTEHYHALWDILSCLEPEEDCTKCGGAFEFHHHRHVTRKGTYHTKCYKKVLEPIKTESKEEIKEVMKEMECWSCDNHLNICDKHTRREKEDKECGCRCHRESGWKPKQRGYLNDHQEWCDHCNPPEECKHYQFSNQPRNCDICKPEINTYNPKECNCECHFLIKVCRRGCNWDKKYCNTPTPPIKFDFTFTKKTTEFDSPSKKCKTSPHCSHNTNGRSFDKPCSVEWKPKDTPPSKQPPPRVSQTRVWQTTRLELIRERYENGEPPYHGQAIKDSFYLLAKLDTALEALEEIDNSQGMGTEERKDWPTWKGSALRDEAIARQALKSINEDIKIKEEWDYPDHIEGKVEDCECKTCLSL